MSDVFKNYLAVGAALLIFAIAILIVDAAIHNQGVSVISAAVLISTLALLEQIKKLTSFRGFLRFTLLIVLPATVFPLDDFGYIPFPSVTLFIAAVVILAAVPIIVLRVLEFRSDSHDIST